MIAEKYRATPAARRMADELGISLSTAIGSGARGRIHYEDVLRVFDAQKKITPLAKRIANEENIDIDLLLGSGYKGKIHKRDLLDQTMGSEQSISKPAEETNDYFNQVKGQYLEMNPMRSTVAKRMSESYFQVPAYTINCEVDMSALLEVRSNMRELVLNRVGEKLTVTDLIVMATAKTLEHHAMLNAAWTDRGVYQYGAINIALAIGLEEGLYVPVIRNTNELSISEIAKYSKEIARKAVANKLIPSDQDGPTFTISNIGMYGMKSFNPIINMPSSAILGVGATIDRVVPRAGEIVIRPIMELCLTLDHRVVDGTPAAIFMKDLKELLENPMGLFI